MNDAANSAGSDRLAFREKFGWIKPGFLSRFILTRHSPLGLANLRKGNFVVFDGSASRGSRESFYPELRDPAVNVALNPNRVAQSTVHGHWR